MTRAVLRYLSDECARHGVAHIPARTVHGPGEKYRAFVGKRDDTALTRRLNVIVPLSFSLTEGVLAASCYAGVEDVLHRHFARYPTEDALFSDEAFAALNCAMEPYLSAWGYGVPRLHGRWGWAYLQTDAQAPPRERILAGTRLLNEADLGIGNRTTMKLSDCIRHGAYAHTVGGEAVCIAAVNSGAGDLAEIGVECAVDHRRRGYAVSCVCALTSHLCEARRTVLYRHYHTNAASAATAEAAGFCRVGRFFAYSCFAG